MNILLLGSGGREHAMAKKLAQSPLCVHLFIAPGNAGTSSCGTNVDLPLNNFNAIKQFVLEHQVEMVVVGPEAPLVEGIVDFFAADVQCKNVLVVGPSKEAAQLEGSKDYAKAFMGRHNIPTARYATFTKETLQDGLRFLSSLPAPYVLKADGLAAGKGVLIIDSLEEAQKELRAMLIDEKFGNASHRVLIEEYLSGIEMSLFVLTDGKHYVLLPEAKDYKRIGEGDTGLNTGGMGSVSPVPFADKQFMNKVEQRIVIPSIRGIHHDNLNYHGFLFVGLMAVRAADGSLDPYVIEYNVRMGDPETESVFPRIKSDMVMVLENCVRGTLNRVHLEVDPRTAACVMMTAGGYPGSYHKGDPISGADTSQENFLLIHAGTKYNEQGQLVTNGGRVLAVTCLANTLPEALLGSYQALDNIHWEGCYFRRDIGQDLLK